MLVDCNEFFFNGQKFYTILNGEKIKFESDYLEYIDSSLFLTKRIPWLRWEYGSRFKLSVAASNALYATRFKLTFMRRCSTPSTRIAWKNVHMSVMNSIPMENITLPHPYYTNQSNYQAIH